MPRDDVKSVEEWLEAIVGALDCSKPLVAQALAAPIRKGIVDRANARSGPDGSWPDNVGAYKAAKAKRGLPVGTGLHAGGGPRMLDADQLEGRMLEPSPGGFRLAYGVDPDTQLRGQYFHNGGRGSGQDGTARSGSPGQLARPFWAATDADERAVAEAAMEILERQFG